MVEQDQMRLPAQDTAFRVVLLILGVFAIAMFGLNAHLERYNQGIKGAETVQRLFEDVDSEMLIQNDLYAISKFLTRELDQRDMAILRLTEDVALSCKFSPDGDFHAELHDVIDGKVSPWTWPETVDRPVAIDALCGMMLSTVAVAQGG